MKLRPLTNEFDALIWLGRRLSETPEWVGAAINKDPQEPGAIMRMGDELHVWTPDGLQIATAGSALLFETPERIFVCKPMMFAAIFAAGTTGE